MSLAPLQAVNERQLNTRSLRTPTKGPQPDLQNKENYINSYNKRQDPNDYQQQQQQQQRKKKEKLSALCKTPPSLIKTRGRDYHKIGRAHV